MAWNRLRCFLQIERERGFLYLCVPVCLGSGATLYFGSPWEPAGWLIIALLAASSGALALSRARPLLRGAALAALLVACGVLAAKLETVRASTKVLGAEVTTRITGRIAKIEPMATGRVRLLLDVMETKRPKLRFAPERVRVSMNRAIPGLQAGSVVSGLVRLRSPSGPVQPGGYDFAFESYFDGIGANGFFLGQPAVLAADKQDRRVSEHIENARAGIAARIRSHVTGPAGEIAAALVVGVRAGIPDDVNDNLRLTGLAHVLSISGLHMALVAATVMVSVRGTLALFPAFAARRPVKKYAAGAALLLLSTYLLMSGAEVAAQRSYIMLAVILLAVMVDRAALTMRNLATAAILILLWSPHEIMGPSFQMSFAATAALIGAFALWTERGAGADPAPRYRQKPVQWLRRAAGALAVLGVTSLVAGAATLVFGAYHFHRISPLALPANLIAMPIVSLLVMPFVVLGILMMPLGLDGPLWRIAGFGLELMLTVSRWLGEASPAGVVGTIPATALIAAATTILVGTIFTTKLRWLAVLPAAMTISAFASRDAPDILIAEDGRLVAFGTTSGALAVSRSRRDRFTAENWQRAAASGSVLSPRAGTPPAAWSHGESAGTPEADPERFLCQAGLCWAQHASGIKLAVADDKAALSSACEWADVIVLLDPSEASACRARKNTQVVLTPRDLARRGSAALRVPDADERQPLDVVFAIDGITRPWHDHRRYSRAARGLPAKKPGPAKPLGLHNEPRASGRLQNTTGTSSVCSSFVSADSRVPTC